MNPSAGLIKFHGIPSAFSSAYRSVFEELYIVNPNRWYVTDVLKVNLYLSICLIPQKMCSVAKTWHSKRVAESHFQSINPGFDQCIFCRIRGFFQMIVLVSQLCNCNTLNEHCEIPLIVMTNISIPVWILISCGAMRHSSAFFALLYRRAFSHWICVAFDSLASMHLTVTWTCVVTVDFADCV